MSSTTTAKAGTARPAENAAAEKRGAGEIVLDVLSAAARFFLAYVWISAGLSKIGHHIQVTQSIEAYEIFTPYWSDLLAQIIGPLELAGGLLLLLGIKLRWSGGVSLVVLALFIIGLWSVHARGMVIDCGCFDPAEGHPDPNEVTHAIWRDLGFVAMTIFMMCRPYRKLAIYP